ncbi:PIN domain containing protein [Klebsormidium nitens]|uniref:PIN domain containing protein n=1 Tax=Klebsormidium nitens TaxID=105231 RepID=A0A1Y1HXD2_KLENI|nr:PIN domain containing protein [Klebsormidium nitens]|eukprot:GAQ82813.1 PIN domain containing protein [Klebsormidium nitens]
MKVKRQKQVRKTIRFYKVCFGFKEPYKVLLDGNFIHQSVHSQAAGQGAIRDVLHKFFSGATKPMVTRCISAELRALGPEFAKSSSAARTLDMARCIHETPVPASECVLSMVGQDNHEHFFVASQDAELRKRLRTVPGTALLFLSTAGLILEPPSETQQKVAKLSEAERLHLNEREQRAALRQLEAAQAAVPAPVESPAAEAPQSEHPEARGQEAAPGPRKRKRPKGPNPLSMKKKKAEDGKGGSKQISQSGGAEGRPKKRSRQRRKKNATDT